jgi:tetratricopeptide (TPR) repeat protein
MDKMAKQEGFRSEEKVNKMSSEAIAAKMQEIVPTFTLNSFLTNTWKYYSSEDLAVNEYFPATRLSNEDADFVRMACEELWSRLIPDRLAVENVGHRFAAITIEMENARMGHKTQEAARLGQEALALIYKYTVITSPTGDRLNLTYYERLQEVVGIDLDTHLDALFTNLREYGDYQKSIDLAGIFGEGLADDNFLCGKAEGLLAAGQKDAALSLFREIMKRNPDNIWYPLKCGDGFLSYAEKDPASAKLFYFEAIAIAEKRRLEETGKLALMSVYMRLMELAEVTQDLNEFEHYHRLFSSLESKKVGRNSPCPCGSGKKYKKCCGGEPAAKPAKEESG